MGIPIHILFLLLRMMLENEQKNCVHFGVNELRTLRVEFGKIPSKRTDDMKF